MQIRTRRVFIRIGGIVKYLSRAMAIGAIAVMAIVSLAGCDTTTWSTVRGVVCHTSFTPEGTKSALGYSTHAQFSATVSTNEGFMTLTAIDGTSSSEVNALNSAIVAGEAVSFMRAQGYSTVGVSDPSDVTIQQAKVSMAGCPTGAK